MIEEARSPPGRADTVGPEDKQGALPPFACFYSHFPSEVTAEAPDGYQISKR